MKVLNKIKSEFPIIAKLLIVSMQIIFALVIVLLTKKEGSEWVIIVISLVVIVSLIMLAITKAIVKFIISSMKIEISGLKGSPEKNYKGLIVLSSIGAGISSAENAIKYHSKQLKRCWLITGGKESKKNAEAMISRLVTAGCSKELFEFVEISAEDSYDPNKVYKKIEEDIYDKLPEEINESDVIGDYTGGTKSMTTGLVLSCTLPSRNLQFMKPNEINKDGYVVFEKGSELNEVSLNFKMKQVKK